MRRASAWPMIGVLAVGSIGTMTAATIVNVALPSVIGALGLGQDEGQWLSTAFLASSTGFMLLNTWAVARFGMRVSFAAAMLSFIAGSVGGAMAPDLTALVIGRVLQGAGAGMIQPMAMLVIYQRMPMEVRGFAVGVYSLGVIVSPAFGPVLGGWLIEGTDWRMVFVATTPLAAIALPLGWWLLPHREGDAQAGPSRARLDWLGLVLVMGTLALLLRGLAQGAREGWDDGGVVALLAGAGVSATAFLLWEAHHPFPVLDLRLFRRPAFCAAGAVIFLTGAVVYGSTWLALLYVQLIQHHSAAPAGEILLPAGVAMALCFPVAGRLSDRVDARVLLLGGAAMLVVSMLAMSEVAVASEAGGIAAAMALGRAGIGVTMPAANASAMRHAGGMLAQAAPAATFLTQTGGALGVAVLSALLQARSAFHADALSPFIDPADAMGALAAGLREAGLTARDAMAGAIGQVTSAVWGIAQMLAFRDCFVVTAGIACVLAPVGLLIPRIGRISSIG